MSFIPVSDVGIYRLTFQVDLSTLNTFQQAIMFVLLIVGHAILISITVLVVRRRAFKRKFKGILEDRAMKRKTHGAVVTQSDEAAVDIECPRKTPLASQATMNGGPPSPYNDEHIHWADDGDAITLANMQTRQNQHHHRMFPMVGVGARLDLNNHPRDVAPNTPNNDEKEQPRLTGVLSGTPNDPASEALVSRNSQFHGLTLEEREQLGGVEYKALCFLSVIVPLYWGMFLIIGIVGMGGWLEANHPDIPGRNGLSAFWTGAFFAVSAFVNSGMALLDANMTALQTRFV